MGTITDDLVDSLEIYKFLKEAKVRRSNTECVVDEQRIDNKLKETKTMNAETNHLITALQQDFYTAQCSFLVPYQEIDPIRNKPVKLYTYKVPSSIILQPNDLVVVKVCDEFKVVEVVKIDEIPNIKYGSEIVYKWIVQKLDTSTYDKLLQDEKLMESMIETKKIQNLKQQFLASCDPFLINTLIAAPDAQVLK